MGLSDESHIWGDKEGECWELYSTQDFQTNHSFQANQTDVCDQDYFSKRIRLSPESDNQQDGEEDGSISIGEESGPLGLRLTKSASFLSLVQSRLRKGKHAGDDEVEMSNNKKMDEMGSQEKMKASNFPAFFIRIGGWQKVSRYEGDVTAKLYYAKKKLVWEVLEGALKSKIEIQWSDITAIRGETPEHECGTLEIEVKQPPAFFRELNPQPRKHTIWQPSSDFTGGHAPTYRRHYLRFPPGVLDKHYHNLLLSDHRLYDLSCTPFPTHASPFFDHTIFQISQLSTLLVNNQGRFTPSSNTTATYPPPPHHIDPTIIHEPRPTLPLPVSVVDDYGVGTTSSSSCSQYFPSWDQAAAGSQGFISHDEQQQPTPVVADSFVDYGVGSSSSQFPSWDQAAAAGSQGFISHDQQQQPTPVVAESVHVDYGVGNSSSQLQYFPSWDQAVAGTQGFISHDDEQQQPTPVVAPAESVMQQQFPPTMTNYDINTTQALYPQQLNWQMTGADDHTNLFMGQRPQITHANSPFFFPDINPTNGGGVGGGGGGFF